MAQAKFAHKLILSELCLWARLYHLAMGIVTSIVQVVLDGTSITLNNATMFPCTNANAELQNQMQIHVPGVHDFGIVGVKLGASTMHMTVEPESWKTGDKHDTYLGSFFSPAQDLDFGRNNVNWDVGVRLNNTNDVLTALVVPVFFEGKSVDLVLKSSDVKLSLFNYGIPITFNNLKLEKKLKCKKIGTTEEREIPMKFCSPVAALEGGRRLAGDTGKGFSMACTPTSSTEIVV